MIKDLVEKANSAHKPLGNTLIFFDWLSVSHGVHGRHLFGCLWLSSSFTVHMSKHVGVSTTFVFIYHKPLRGKRRARLPDWDAENAERREVDSLGVGSLVKPTLNRSAGLLYTFYVLYDFTNFTTLPTLPFYQLY